MSANCISGWLTCNMGCSRRSLIKLAPAIGVNVCELVFVSEVDIFITCFNFPTFFRYLHSMLHILHKNVVNRHCDFIVFVTQMLVSFVIRSIQAKPINFDRMSKRSAVIIDLWILQDNVATQLRWGGRPGPCNNYIESFLGNLPVTKIWKSLYISRSYDQQSCVVFWLTV